jgi:hypothetical protein
MRWQRDDLVDERHQQQHQDQEEREQEQASVLHSASRAQARPLGGAAGVVVAAAARPARISW